MAINKNHEFEELNGIKCAIVEKNASPQRVEFLKNVLEHNGYEVVVVASPAPKAAPAARPATPANEEVPQAATSTPNTSIPQLPETFTVGVTDVTFNPVNAIFGRALRTSDEHVVTLAYWQQKEPVADDETPYFENP